MQNLPATQPQPQPQPQPEPQRLAGPASPPAPSAFAVRPVLPDRDVTGETIEDAYVRFIFYCNPALPLSTDTTALREAFNSPPRSGGKTFSTFAIYQLVRRFYDKDIRTWTELTTTLGVEPPDITKDESAQKIAQYGVRLKKWMNSMHVRAFFEYLMNIPNEYWTRIPTDPNPVAQPVRDGVAIEDDMALRALIPHIRPKRGRKRPGDDEATLPSAQRSRLSPSSAIDGSKQRDAYEPPSAHAPRGANVPWTPIDGTTPNLAPNWPQSAITPTARHPFWDDALEPRSAVTPSRPRLSGQRRGPKNVSSAWKPGGPDNGVRTRGRPPINRMSLEAASSPLPPDTPVVGPREPSNPTPLQSAGPTSSPFGQGRQTPSSTQTSSPAALPISAPTPPFRAPDSQRPARPSITLQVPERPTGTVRLATPPPVVVISGEDEDDGAIESTQTQAARTGDRTSFVGAVSEALGQGGPGPLPAPISDRIGGFHFERTHDRTNVEGVLNQLTRVLMDANWLDEQRRHSYSASIDEAIALSNAMVETMYKAASSPQVFLVTLAALTGGRALMSSAMRIVRMGRAEGAATYLCEWEYAFGGIGGQYKMEQRVPLSMLGGVLSQESTTHGAGQDDAGQAALTAEEWKSKYQRLLADVENKDREVDKLQSEVVKRAQTGAGKEAASDTPMCFFA